MNERLVGISAMGGAATCWGLSGLFIAHIPANGTSVASLVSLVTAVVMLSVALLRHRSIFGVLSQLGWSLPLLGAVEAVNAATYYMALHLAPVGIVISLHLTAPILLLGWQLGRKQRSMGRRELLSLLALVVAVAMIGAGGQHTGTFASTVLAMVLSLSSAAAIAVFEVLARNRSQTGSLLVSGGVQMMCSGLLLSPAFIIAPIPRADLGPLVAVALLLFAPAAFMFWQAISRIPVVVALTISLFEPVSATVVGALVYASAPGYWQAPASALVLAAAWLEITGPHGGAVDQLGAAEQREVLLRGVESMATADQRRRSAP